MMPLSHSMADSAAAPSRVDAVLALAAQQLQQADITQARLDARLLLAHAMGVTPELLFMHPEHTLTAEQGEIFSTYMQRRMAHEPVSRIVGVREFWSLEFAVSPDVLDPRPDSETLVEAAIEFAYCRIPPPASAKRSLPSPSRGRVRERVDALTALNVLDLGTGSGCLLLAVLFELPQASGTGVDISDAALTIAQRNARAHDVQERVQFIRSDWDQALEGRFDIILSNPPYIASGDIPSLAAEVAQFDPSGALDGGADGLTCYRAVLRAIKARLAPGGRAFIELGAGQAAAVSQLAMQQDLYVMEIRSDLAGVERCLVLE